MKIVDIEETRAHALTQDFEVDNGAPYSGSSTVGGETTTTATTFMICTDNALVDPITGPTGATAVSSLVVVDLGATGHPSFTMNGFVINSNAFPIKMTPSTSGGAERVFVIQNVTTTMSHVSGGMTVIDGGSSTNTVYIRKDYNLTSNNLDGVAIDSRKVYGQPDLAGELSADANAPLRNPSFYGWVFKGGLFAGNSPFGGSDQSGTARTQFYLTGSPTFATPVWEDLVICYLGTASGYASDANYRFSIPSSSDPNLGIAESAATWANAWNLTTATAQPTLSLTSFTSGQYLNFQGVFSPKLVLSLVNEATDISSGVGDWRYFACPGYATSSGLMTVADAQPHAWVLDLTYHEN